MSAQRTERMLNLVIALLATRRWLTKEQIRTSVPQYGECASTEAFDRMFERDKEELRELGVPIETGTFDPVFEDEPGYRIDAEAYALPAIDFTPAELTVLRLAARVWQQASLAGPAARGLVKLKSLGVPVDESSLVGVEPRVLTTEPAFAPLYAATRDRAPVSFDYLKDGQTQPQRRTVEPWRISSWHGRWYLHGLDRDRGADRVFRLSRVRGSIRREGAAGTVEVPAGVDTRAAVRRVAPTTPSRTARVALDPHTGLVLRRQAGADPACAVIEVQFSDLDDLAGQIAAVGAHAEVLTPPDLRAAVCALLAGAAAAHRDLRPADGLDGESE